MFENLFNDDKKQLKKLNKFADKVESLASIMETKTDDELKAYTDKFKKDLANGKTLDDIEVEAFAVVREVAKRTRGEYPYREQIMGGHVLHNGDIAELKTGEGKTLTASMPVYLNALEGKGVHVVTVNEYLSQRDADAMGQIYNFLGLSVGFNGRDMSQAEKRKAYACDITYSTNSELGFDYLRDNMVSEAKDRVQRGLHYVLVDEADSILIDEARTPLIISGKSTEESDKYISVDRAVKSLKEEDYEIFTKENQVALTLSGIERLQNWFHVKNLYDPQNQKTLHKINKSLYANYILKKDIDYIVDGDDIELVDKFTGRVLKGHAYSEGLQQAIQAKEGVEIKPENKTVATITYQNFFRMYDKLSGMTGTAKTEEEEFLSIYNMFVIPVPTHRPVIREDKLDAIYRNKDVKYKAIVNEVKKAYLSGRPVLIGTADIETNELLSKMLDDAEIPHETLNAKNHAKEAEIIAKAGFPHAVTLATDMAGRGTDIKLPKASRDLGGLYVIGTERHESRRIDNQLRGRSGRQGDPGASIFFLSLEDDLMKRFGGPKIQKMFEKAVSDERLESKSLSKAITNAQKEIEGANFDMRKQIIEFDDVLREQREVYYEKRDAMVDAEVKDLPALFRSMFDTAVLLVVNECSGDLEELYNEFHDVFQIVNLNDRSYQYAGEIVSMDELKAAKNIQELTRLLQDRLWDYYIQLISINENCYRQCLRIGKKVGLQVMDEEWIDHIDYMDKLRGAISLRSYAQKKPVEEYKEEGYQAFYNFMSLMSLRVTETLVSVRPTVIYQGGFGIPKKDE